MVDHRSEYTTVWIKKSTATTLKKAQSKGKYKSIDILIIRLLGDMNDTDKPDRVRDKAPIYNKKA
jgi:hypothetical protein